MTKKLLVSIVLFVSNGALAKQKSVTFELKPTSGKVFLNLFAAICEDKEWNSISKWAKQTDFENATVPGVELVHDGTPTFKSGNSEITVSGQQLTIKTGNETTTGTACEIIARHVSQKKQSQSAIGDLLLPRAYAQAHRTRPIDDGDLIGRTVAGAGAGCALGAGVGVWAFGVGAVPGCLVGTLGGMVAGVGATMYLDATVIHNGGRLEAQIEEFWDNARVVSCSRSSARAVLGNRQLDVIRDRDGSATVEIRQGGRLLYRQPNMDGVYGLCFSAADAAAINNRVAADLARRNARRAPATDRRRQQNPGAR